MARDVPGPAARDERFALAWNLLDRADELSAAAFRSGGYETWTKADGSPVTDVDMRVEDVLTGGIRAAFGADSVLAEEGGRIPGDSVQWVIDPLDGSANFIEGIPVYAHMVALLRAGSPVFALVSSPVLGRRWWAYRGCGAFERTRRVAASTTARLDGARIAYGGLRDYDPPSLDGLVRLIRRCMRSRGFGNFLPHMLVAEGTYDLASSGGGGEPWDVAPLGLIVEEAGGRMTSLRGGAWDAADPVLTSNAILHGEALRIVNGKAG
ncbi:inositol monophosphatase family protein [Actinomadura monticuli]|uniref:Inositol monophosphatase n=1 Tax=Actinomadura monticuli TaxID=3097367 RepID=A0ABV4Q6C4_9ACTN